MRYSDRIYAIKLFHILRIPKICRHLPKELLPKKIEFVQLIFSISLDTPMTNLDLLSKKKKILTKIKLKKGIDSWDVFPPDIHFFQEDLLNLQSLLI